MERETRIGSLRTVVGSIRLFLVRPLTRGTPSDLVVPREVRGGRVRLRETFNNKTQLLKGQNQSIKILPPIFVLSFLRRLFFLSLFMRLVNVVGLLSTKETRIRNVQK